MLKAKNITKTFRTPIDLKLLRGIDLEVEANSTLAIMGTSGVGKTTLLHILGTLEKPDSGIVTIAGKEPSKDIAKIRNEQIGFIFQSFFLFDNLSALQNVLMPAKIARKNIREGSTAYQRAIALIERVGLQDRMHFLAKNLSGGEKQRVSIARALCNNPSIVLADEPTGNLDTHTSEVIQNLLIESVAVEKKTLVVVTHDINFAKACDRILQLKNGLLQ